MKFVFSSLFHTVIKIRTMLYQLSFFSITSLPTKVLSVGNISVGGTGKTPLTCYIANLFLEAGKKPLILSRGYGRKSNELVFLKANETVEDVKLVGDEPFMIKSKVPASELLIHRKRGMKAKEIWKQINSELVILDDGFQHWRLKRDFDIVTIDMSKSIDDHLIPFGKNRESIDAINRADLILYTRCNEIDLDELEKKHEQVAKILEQPKGEFSWKNPSSIETAVFYSYYKSIGVKSYFGSRTIGKNNSIFLVSGIANPLSFEKSARSMGFDVVEHFKLKDHEDLNSHSLRKIEERYSYLRESNSESLVILTTEKDFARWSSSFQKLDLPLFFLEISICIFDPYNKQNQQNMMTAFDNYILEQCV